MNILVNRDVSNKDATVSVVSIDGVNECYAVEDECRAVKVMHETRIPAGTYKVGLLTVGGFHAKYSQRFAAIHKGMLHVQDVPGFTGILIHCGNTDDDTSGCLCLGSSRTTGGELRVNDSRTAYRNFYSKVVGAAKSGKLTIAYVDNDRRVP